jgi:DNA-binding CsgD family transcriptional regulator
MLDWMRKANGKADASVIETPAPELMGLSEMTLTPNGNPFRKAVKYAAKGKVALIGPAGSGKCLGKGTPVLRYDGSVVPVEEIAEGDLLMGPDSKPRTVLRLCRGEAPLYRVDPVKGDPWVCNEDHILTLAGTNHHAGKVRDIAIKDWMAFSPTSRQNWKLFRCGVEFQAANELPVDPHLVGLWLGDGTTTATHITSADAEVLDYLKTWAAAHGVSYCEAPNRRGSTLAQFTCRSREERSRQMPAEVAAHPTLSTRQRRIAALATAGQSNRSIAEALQVNTKSVENSISAIRRKAQLPLAKQNFWLRDFLFGECRTSHGKQIPFAYLTASRQARLELLAGLVDSDGYLANGYYEICTKWRALASQILFLARSLGFAAYSSTKTVRLDSERTRDYQRITISGNIAEVPVLLARKKARPRGQIKRTHVTGFSLSPIGAGEYYGFTLDGDGRFLLGDFTVTHNSYTALLLARALAGPNGKIAAIDTEHGSLSKYADLFNFDVIELDTFSPSTFVDSLRAAEEARYDVFICDSLSHFWVGKDGALEFVDMAAKRHKDNMGGWKEFRPHERQMVDEMVASPCHVICTMRTKTDYQEQTDSNGKKKRVKIGLAPVQRDGLEYEFDLVGYMDEDNTFIVDKTRCPDYSQKAYTKPGPKEFAPFVKWLQGTARAPRPKREPEIHTGGHPVGTQAAADYVAQQKIASMNGVNSVNSVNGTQATPVTVHNAPWKNMGELKQALADKRQEVGEVVWREQLERFGWRSMEDLVRAVDTKDRPARQKALDAAKELYFWLDALRGVA